MSLISATKLTTVEFCIDTGAGVVSSQLTLSDHDWRILRKSLSNGLLGKFGSKSNNVDVWLDGDVCVAVIKCNGTKIRIDKDANILLEKLCHTTFALPPPMAIS